jgi:hypothetical protein
MNIYEIAVTDNIYFNITVYIAPIRYKRSIFSHYQSKKLKIALF